MLKADDVLVEDKMMSKKKKKSTRFVAPCELMRQYMAGCKIRDKLEVGGKLRIN